MGNFTGAQALCSAAAEDATLGCRVVIPMICTSVYTLSAAPQTFNFAPGVQIEGPSGTIIAPNWNALMTSGPIWALYIAGVPGDSSNRAYCGCGSNGAGYSNNCNDFTTASPTVYSQWMNMAAAAPNWIYISSQQYTCNTASLLTCACIGQKVITALPSHSPTSSKPSRSPTQSPSSSKPSKSPTTTFAQYIQLFPAYPSGTGVVAANLIGGSICSNVCVTSRSAPLLCYATAAVANLPTLLNFNPSIPVVGNYFGTLIAANWSAFMNLPLQSTLTSAMTGLTGSVWSGCTAGGASVSANGNCGNWASAAGNGETLSKAVTTASTWIAAGTAACTNAINYMCVCISDRSPTASPTSSKPSASPTSSKPSASPTSSKPSASPTSSKPSRSPTTSPTNYPIQCQTFVATQTLSPSSDFFYSVSLGATVTYSGSQIATCFASNGNFATVSGGYTYGCNPYYSGTSSSGPTKIDTVRIRAGPGGGGSLTINIMLCINDGGAATQSPTTAIG